MVTKGVTNTRLKDFYDVDRLARTMEFRGEILASSIKATFAKRGNFPPEMPVALEPGFLTDPVRATAWKSFLKRGRLDAGLDAAGLHARVHEFLHPVWRALAKEQPFRGFWSPGGPWRLENETDGDA